jgi:hypothetical protein
METMFLVRRVTNTIGKCKYLTTWIKRKCLARDFSGLEAGCADVLALGVTVYQGADALDIWIPTAAGTTV